MNNKIKTFAAAAAIIAAGSTMTLAQDSGVDIGVDAGAGISAGSDAGTMGLGVDGKTGIKAGAGLMGTSDATFNSLIASVKTGANIDVNAIQDEGDVEIINVATLKGEGDTGADALKGALDSNQTAVADLRTKIESNVTVRDELEAEGFEVANVVAADTAADGHIVLYVMDNA